MDLPSFAQLHVPTMMRNTLNAAALFTSGLLCAQYTATVKTTVTEVESSAWRKWSDANCSVNYPSGWTSEGSGINDRAASFQAPLDGTDRTRDRVDLHVKPTGGRTINEIAKDAESEITSTLTNAKVIGSNTTNDIHTLEYSGVLNGRLLRVKQESHVKNGRTWILSFTSDPERFDDALYLADAMFASFMVK